MTILGIGAIVLGFFAQNDAFYVALLPRNNDLCVFLPLEAVGHPNSFFAADETSAEHMVKDWHQVIRLAYRV